MVISGVYLIQNKQTGDSYIGSSCDIKQRWNRHKRDLENNKHHSIYLNRAYKKYGSDSFEFSILEEISKEDLLLKEQYYLDKYKPIYNTYKVAGSPSGFRYSEDQKARSRKYALDNKIKPPKSTYEYKMRKVLMLNKTTGEIVREFESLSAGARYLGKGPDFASSIREVCNGKRKSILGYNWKFVSNESGE